MKKILTKIYCKKCNFEIIVSNSLTVFIDGSCYASDKSISDELGFHNDKNKSHTEFDIATSW
jgi:hypothetical protein